MKTTSVPNKDLRSSSDRLFLQIAAGGKTSVFVRKELYAGIGAAQQFRQAVPAVHHRQRASIFVRK
jgi:hypothetical protein